MAYSRLQVHEKNLLVRQTLLFFLGGVGILVLFFFVLLPIFTKVLMFSAKKALPASSAPTANIPAPVISAPFTATNSAKVNLTGQATAGISVLLGVNGSVDMQTKANDKGEFVFENVTLSSGENLIIAYAQDDDNNRSDGSNALTITYSTDAPKLEVTEPSEGAVVTQRKQSVIQVKGQTDAGNKVYLNDQFLFVSSDGSFTGSFQLVSGDNTLVVRAINSSGNEAAKEVHVKYLP